MLRPWLSISRSRRTATVMTWAPEASRQSRIWSNEAYLPVPTINREESE